MDEVFESVTLAEELRLRLHEHLPSECLEHFLSDLPIEDVHHSCLLLSVKFISFFKIVYEIRLINYLVALGLVELPRLLDQLLVEVDSREEAIVCQLALAEFDVNFDDISELLVRSLHDLLAQSLLLDLIANSIGQLVTQGIEYDFFEDFVTLVIQ